MVPTGTTNIRRLYRADLHLLGVFMTVAQCGGFAAAQVTLNVDQSTISRQIGDLERRLGMRLCQRGRAGFHLTDKGRVVYEACQHLSIALESFRTTVGALRGELCETGIKIAGMNRECLHSHRPAESRVAGSGKSNSATRRAWASDFFTGAPEFLWVGRWPPVISLWSRPVLIL